MAKQPKRKNPNMARSGEFVAASSKINSEEVAKYREIANKFREARKFKQEYFFPMYKRLEAYIESQRGKEKPLTISGLILASGVSQTTFNEMRNGKHDYALYQYADYEGVDLENDIVEDYNGLPYHVNSKGIEVLLVPASEILQRALLLQQEETETRLYEKGRVGDIFSLKAQHGWQEEEKQQITNNTLVIASESDSQRALQRLLGNTSTD